MYNATLPSLPINDRLPYILTIHPVIYMYEDGEKILYIIICTTEDNFLTIRLDSLLFMNLLSPCKLRCVNPATKAPLFE